MESGKKAAIIFNGKAYPRNQVLKAALNGAFGTVTEILAEDGHRKNIRLIIKLLKSRPLADKYFFGWPANHLVPTILLVKILGKYVIYDAFTSAYDSAVNDRRQVRPESCRAFYYYLQDYLCCHLADVLVFDTEGHKKYFFKTFRLKFSKKYVVLPVSLDLEWISRLPSPAKGAKFAQGPTNILFYGSFIPLQGIEYILKAIQLTKDLPVRFWIIGDGQTYPKMRNLAENLDLNGKVTFLPPVPYPDLFNYIKEADICLGIFGNTEKAQRTIPNKVLECAACAKPVITGRNDDLSGFFRDRDSVLFCPMADAQALAETIRWAMANQEQWAPLGQKAYEVVQMNYSLPALTAKIKNNSL